jgi:hypothetical protein
MEPFVLDALDREATRGIILVYRVYCQYGYSTYPSLDETNDTLRDLSVVLL